MIWLCTSQEILFDLEQVIASSDNTEEFQWQSIPVILDSPLAADITREYQRYAGLWDKDAREHFTNRRQHHLAVGPLYERHAEFVFQLFQLGGQRRLTDKTGFRSLTEVAILCHRNQIFQITQIHVIPGSTMILAGP